MTKGDIEQRLANVYAKGLIMLPSGEQKVFTGTVTLPEAITLAHKVIQLAPQVTIETGVAYGLSTLAICLALEANGKGVHYGADPEQKRVHQMAGVELLRQHGVAHRFRLLDGPAHEMLPALRERIQFAFIDGWHTFDYKLIDFFLADKLLEPGGVIGFHDCQWASTQRVLRFALTHRKYRLLLERKITVFEAARYCRMGRLGKFLYWARSVALPVRKGRVKNLLLLEKIQGWEPNYDFYASF